jgi:hypothetical protein
MMQVREESGRSPRCTFPLQRGSYSQDFLVFPRSPDDLHGNGKTFLQLTHGNHGGRISEQVEPLDVTPGVKIVDSLAARRRLILDLGIRFSSDALQPVRREKIFFADLFRHSHGREKSELIHKWVRSSFARQSFEKRAVPDGAHFCVGRFPGTAVPCGWSVPVRASSPG